MNNGMQWFNNLLFPAQCRFIDLIEGGANQVFAVSAAIRLDKKLSGELLSVTHDYMLEASRVNDSLSPLLVRKMRAQVRQLVDA